MSTEPAYDGGEHWIPDDGDFGMRLAMVRQHLGGLNITRAAALCGLSAESWRTWEKGVRPHDREGVSAAIEAATGADYDWLMSGRGGGIRTGSFLTPVAMPDGQLELAIDTILPELAFV